MNKGGTVKTFVQFEEAFSATFTYTRSRSDKLKAMMLRTQKQNEVLQNYVLDKIWLCNELDFNVSEIRDEVASGVWSKELAHYILGRTYNTTDKMLQDMVKIESINEVRRERALECRVQRNPVRTERVNQPSTSTAMVSWRQDNVGATSAVQREEPTVNIENINVSSTTRSSYGKTVKCYNCGQSGHLSKNCKQNKNEIICFSCKRPGHVASRCKYNSNVNTRESSTVNIEEIKIVNSNEKLDTGNKFIRKVQIGNSDLTAKIDMGASENTIKATVVIREGLKINSLVSKLEGFGNKIVESPGTVEEIIKIDNLNPRKMTLGIVPHTAQRYDIILGRSFTKAKDITYTRIGDNLTFAEIDINICDQSTDQRPRCLERVELEPGIVNFINVKINEDEIIMPVVNCGEKREITEVGERIGETILGIEEEEEIPVRCEEISEDEFFTDSSLTVEQKNELKDLLNNYKDCVARNIFEIGKTNKITMEINANTDELVQRKFYRLNSTDREDLDELVKEYKEAGIIKDTKATYASPAFIIRKKDETIRMVVDYRRLNSVTKVFHYPILMTLLNN